MIVDASALLAILLDESDGELMEDLILRDRARPAMSPMNYLEAAVRIDRLGSKEKSEKLDRLLAALDIELVDTTPLQTRLAREAYKRYGKGNHPARLNLGDCFAYALAKARSEPLLFKGDDFRQTDVEAAI